MQLRVTCVIKIVHIQVKSPNVEIPFSSHKGLLLKEIRSLWEKILSFKWKGTQLA